MADLRAQLRSYVEATIERVDAEDILAARAVTPTSVPGRVSWRRPAVVALGAALATLAVIGGVALIFGRLGGEVVTSTTFADTTTTTFAVTTTATTTTLPSSSTVPATTTTTVPVFPAALAMTWERVPHQAALEGGWVAAATNGGPGVVAVGGATRGADAAVWLSTDGSAWERVDSESFHGLPGQFGDDGDQFMTDVVLGPGGLVAVGGDNQQGAAVWLSPDGRSWTRAPHDDAVFGAESYGFMHAATLGGPGLVAVGESDQRATVWLSADGTVWERVFTGEQYEFMEGVVAWGGRLYAVGYSGWLDCCPRVLVAPFRPKIWVSADGRTWESLPETPLPGEPGIDVGPSPEDEWNLYGVTADDAGLLAFGEALQDGAPDVPALWRSTDGEAWTRSREAFLGEASIYYLPTALLADGSRLLAAHGEASVWSSADGGESWHRITAFELGEGFQGGGEVDATGAPPYYSYLNDLVALGGRILAFGKDDIWSDSEDIGGTTCEWDPGDGSAGQCRTDAAVWIGTWDEG